MNANNEIRICPSILNVERSHLTEEIAKVAKDADLLHLDIMDNIFVPNLTFSIDEARQIIQRSPLPVDSHLMVYNPDDLAPRYAEMGSASVTFHFEATDNIGPLIHNIRSNGARVGLAIKPGTAFSEIADYLGEIDMLLVMTVEPGFGGQKFMADMLPKVHMAKRWKDENAHPHLWIQVDGGISLTTIKEAAINGADTFVAGSAVFSSSHPQSMIQELRQQARN